MMEAASSAFPREIGEVEAEVAKHRSAEFDAHTAEEVAKVVAIALENEVEEVEVREQHLNQNGEIPI